MRYQQWVAVDRYGKRLGSGRGCGSSRGCGGGGGGRGLASRWLREKILDFFGRFGRFEAFWGIFGRFRTFFDALGYVLNILGCSVAMFLCIQLLRLTIKF